MVSGKIRLRRVAPGGAHETHVTLMLVSKPKEVELREEHEDEEDAFGFPDLTALVAPSRT